MEREREREREREKGYAVWGPQTHTTSTMFASQTLRGNTHAPRRRRIGGWGEGGREGRGFRFRV
jgi:hypothetical protein